MQSLQRSMWWIRDARNPVLPNLPGSEFECDCCMNPCVVRVGDEYRLYYAGGDAQGGRRRICLATAPVADLRTWTRHGVVLDVGEPGAFDAAWTVLPHVIRVGDRWHLYYTANCGRGKGLSAFPGIGLAVSDDGLRFERLSDTPILAPSGRAGDPDAIGMAGGSVLPVTLGDGSTEWRYYYTGCPTLGDDVFQDQQKTCCLAVSKDAVHWEKRGPIMFRIPERDYVDVAAAGPVVWQEEDDGLFRMLYSAIGTRWGWYAIGYAESADGMVWRRGEHYGDDLTLGPVGTGWEQQMVEYPASIREGARRRLFYCGNGYGRTGIGTALSCPLRASATVGACKVRIHAPEAGAEWAYRLPEALSCAEGCFKSHVLPVLDWRGPTGDGMLWHEWQTDDEHFAAAIADPRMNALGITFIQGMWYRAVIRHADFGLEISVTAKNIGERTFHNVTAFPCLSALSPAFHDNGMERTFIVTESGLAALGKTDRGSGDPVRTHYGVKDRVPMAALAKPFWGDASSTVAVDGAILRTSADGRWTIGTNWEGGAAVYHNEDANHHCIHSVPNLGDIQPGETKSVRGRLVFVEGGPQDGWRLLQFRR